MATNLYLVGDQCFVTPTAGDKATNLPKATNGNAAGSEVEGCLRTWWGGSGNVVNRTVNTTGTAVNQSYFFGRFSSLPLQDQTIPAQNWNWAMIVGEGSNSANTFIWPVMYVWRPSTNAVVGYVFDAAAAAGSEIAATPGTATRNFAGSAVTTQEGDLLVVEAWMSGTPTAAVFTQTWRITDKASAIVSPYNILFKPDTSLWVTTAIPATAPTAGVDFATSLPLAQNTVATGGLGYAFDCVWEITTPPNDTNQLGRNPTSFANTNPQSAFMGRFSTKPLAAQTIPVQDWIFELSYGETNANVNAFIWPVIYAWRPSTQAVVGYVFNATGPQGVELRVNADPQLNQVFTGASVTLQDGDILCLEAWTAGSQSAATAYGGPQLWTNSFNSLVRSPYVILPYVAPPATANAALTEAADSISSTATVAWVPATATSAMTETADTVSSTAVVPPFPVINATLAVTEAADALSADVQVVAVPKLSTLQEDFELPVNPGKWDDTNVFNGSTVFQNGVGEFTTTSTVNTSHASLISQGNFDFKDSSVYWKIVRPPTWAAIAAGGEFSLAVESPGSNRIDWTIYSNGDISIIKFTNNTWGQIKAVDTGYYSKQDTYRWLRTRETAGTTYWESAPSTASNPPIEADWVVRHSALTNTLPINAGITNVKAVYRLWISGTAQGALTQSGQIDGFNTAANAALGTATATLAVTEAADAISSTVTVVPFPTRVATLSLTEAADALSSTAQTIIGATLNSTETPDSIVSTATVSRAASASMTEANDTVASTAVTIIGATVAVTEANDSIASTATVVWPPVTANLSVTEAADTAAGTASLITPTLLYFSDTVPAQAPTAGDKSTYMPGTGLFRDGWTPEATWTTTVPPGPETIHSINVGPGYDGGISGFFGRFSTSGLYAQTIPAQNWTYGPKVGGNANVQPRHVPVMYVWRPSNNTVVGYIFDANFIPNNGVPWPTSGGVQQQFQTFAGASVTTQAGDILVIETWSYGVDTIGNGSGAQWYSNSAVSYVSSPYTIQFQGAPALADLTRIEANDTLSATVSTPVVATAAITEAKDTLSSDVDVVAKATAGITEAGDSIASTVSAIAGATLARTEAGDTLSSTALLIPVITATLSVTEAPDTISSTGTVVNPALASMVATEAPDTLSATAEVSLYGISTANLNVTEAPDTVLGYTVKPRKRAILIT